MSNILVQSGVFSGSITEPDWTLLDVGSWSEDRVFERFIRFDRAFQAPPTVHVGLCGFDIDNTINARLCVRAENVCADGFTIQMRTWLNSRMWSVEINWLAIGVVQ